MTNDLTYQYDDSIIEKKDIKSNGEENYRYSLYIPFKNKKPNTCAMIIMKNPSKANKDTSDKSINNVIRFCNNKYSSIYITNLFPCYGTNPTILNSFINSNDYESKMKNNHEKIEYIFENVNDVIIAWGTINGNKKIDSKYEQQVNFITECANQNKKELYAMRFTSSKNPWHPRNWESEFDLTLYKVGVQVIEEQLK